MVLPVGAVVNMDGTALYEAVASLFIAQLNKMSMDIGTVIIVRSVEYTCISLGLRKMPFVA